MWFKLYNILFMRLLIKKLYDLSTLPSCIMRTYCWFIFIELLNYILGVLCYIPFNWPLNVFRLDYIDALWCINCWIPAPQTPYTSFLKGFFHQAESERQTHKMKQNYCQTLTVCRNIDRFITDSRVLSTLQFIEANRGELSGKLPVLFTNQQATLFASHPNCFWVIWHISTLLCYFSGSDFEYWSFPTVQDLYKH